MTLSDRVKWANSFMNEGWRFSLLHCVQLHYMSDNACECDQHRTGYLWLTSIFSRLIGASRNTRTQFHLVGLFKFNVFKVFDFNSNITLFYKNYKRLCRKEVDRKCGESTTGTMVPSQAQNRCAVVLLAWLLPPVYNIALVAMYRLKVTTIAFLLLSLLMLIILISLKPKSCDVNIHQ